MSDVDQSLARIATLAPEVAGAHAEQVAAIDAEQTAEAAILYRALHLAAPAGRAVASQVASSAWRTGAGLSRATSRTLHARGVVLDGGPAPQSDPERGGVRPIDDAAIVWIPYSQTAICDARRLDPDDVDAAPRKVERLLTPGLYRVYWSGAWSLWQGSASGYVSDWTRMSSRELMRDYRLDSMLARLSEALEAQAKASRPTKAATERAAKLRAVLALI